MPLHIHHDTDETFYLVEGELDVEVGGERFTATAGDFVFGRAACRTAGS